MSNLDAKVLRGGFTIYTGQEAAIDELITELEKRSQASLIVVADTAGEPIHYKGNLDNKKKLALGSLVAGDLAASQETARIIGEYESFQLIIREGLESTLFISEAGNQLILLCVVPAKIPLGWSRLLVKETSKQIASIVSTPDDQIDLLDLGLNDELLADKYGDSLSGIWNG